MLLEDLKLDRSYYDLLQEIVNEARQQAEIFGMMLIGSHARGDALPGTDLDLRFILSPGKSRPFQSETRDGIMVERSYADQTLAEFKLATNPMEVYPYLDGRILFDPLRVLAHLTTHAQSVFAQYQISEKERNEIAHWLKSVRLKITVASNARDSLKVAYIVSTASWPILTGLWAANNKPMPPNGSVWPHLKDLSKRPPALEELLTSFFCGEVEQRTEAALELLDWILTSLAHPHQS